MFPVVIAKAPYKKTKAKTKATAKATRENNDLIGWIRENNRAACFARTEVEFFDVFCQTTTENFQIYRRNDIVNTQQ